MSVIAADSRVSPVSALNAKPRTAMFCPKRINIQAYYYKRELGYLVGDGVEEGVNYALREAAFLVFVKSDDLAPICGHFRKVKTLRKVNEVEDVFLEARATKPDRGPQKFGPHARVTADSVRDFLDVSACRFAYGR